jgi:polyribonucleotide nucleotidyltransferase
VNIKEDGTVTVSGFDDAKINDCIKKIEEIAGAGGGEGGGAKRVAYAGPMPAVGTLLAKCEVVSVKAFGVFVKLGDDYPGLEGLVHISELHTERIRNIEGFIEPGAIIDVKVLGLSDDGKLKLSRKATLVAAA